MVTLNLKDAKAGKTEYCIVTREDGKQAIFTKDRTQQISGWWNRIYEEGLVNGKSDYYIVRNDEGKESVMHKNGTRVVSWVSKVYLGDGVPLGAVSGVSDYIVSIKDDGLVDIYNVKNHTVYPLKIDAISLSGFLIGQSDYAVVKKFGRVAVVDKEFKKPSDWYDRVFVAGVISGESEYYLAEKDMKKAIFSIQGKQVSGWYENIYCRDLLAGKSHYFLAFENNTIYFCHAKLGVLSTVELDQNRSVVSSKTLRNLSILTANGKYGIVPSSQHTKIPLRKIHEISYSVVDEDGDIVYKACNLAEALNFLETAGNISERFKEHGNYDYRFLHIAV